MTAFCHPERSQETIHGRATQRRRSNLELQEDFRGCLLVAKLI
jgi:hypothetical protein